MKTEWGYGAARLVRPSTREETEVAVFLSDLHFPYQDQALVDSALRLVRRLKPHRVVVNGDVADFFQLSRFNVRLERVDHLQEEIDLANDFRRKLRKAAPNAQIDETEGNHDSRVKTYVGANARALVTLRALEPAQLFLHDELEFTPHPGAGFLLRPHFLVKHGNYVRKDVPNTAKAELETAGVSGVSGHTHRLGTYRKAGYGIRQWTEGGCLCRLDPDYVVGAPNWHQGITIGEFSTKTDSFVIYEVPAVDGHLRFGGRSF